MYCEAIAICLHEGWPNCAARPLLPRRRSGSGAVMSGRPSTIVSSAGIGRQCGRVLHPTRSDYHSPDPQEVPMAQHVGYVTVTRVLFRARSNAEWPGARLDIFVIYSTHAPPPVCSPRWNAHRAARPQPPALLLWQRGLLYLPSLVR